jgi:hypothetical protein
LLGEPFSEEAYPADGPPPQRHCAPAPGCIVRPEKGNAAEARRGREKSTKNVPNRDKTVKFVL